MKKKTTIKMNHQPLTAEQQKLVKDNKVFADNIGRRYRALGKKKGLQVEDLMQESCLGMCEAAVRFDASKGVAFQTYAFFWCEKFVKLAIKYESSALTVDQDVELMAEEPEDDKVPEHIQREKDCQHLEGLMEVLSKKECQVVRLIYGLDGEAKTPAEAAKEVGLSTDRVRRICDAAVGKMEIEAQSEQAGVEIINQ